MFNILKNNKKNKNILPKCHLLVYFMFAQILIPNASKAESYERSYATSVAKMQELIETEAILLVSTIQYADALNRKAETIRSTIKNLIIENEKASQNSEEYLGNPFNSFRLIRRLHGFWRKWPEYLRAPADEAVLESIEEGEDFLPTDQDLLEAVEGMQRIQSIYKMNPIYMAEGYINGVKYGSKLSTSDLLTIGYELLQNGYQLEAIPWLNAVLHTDFRPESNDFLGLDKALVCESQLEVLYHRNLSQEALGYIDTCLKFNPEGKNLLDLKTKLQLQANSTFSQSWREFISGYDRCCRGECLSRRENLHCTYNETFSAFYKIAPFKMEELSLDPYIVKYFDFVSDSEIESLKSYAQFNLQRARVSDGAGDFDEALEISKERTAQNAWVEDNRFGTLDQRVEDVTGFKATGFEHLSILNYGIGGHYDEHTDYFDPVFDDFSWRVGDRIATILIYMTDAVEGGLTAFPRLKVAVRPEKGSALVWYNLKSNGRGDDRTLHGACPAIVGSRWASTIWIRMNDQFLARPCYHNN